MSLTKVTNMQDMRHRQQDPLDLRSLPPVAPQKDGWPEIESALLQQGGQRRWIGIGGAGLAAAAAVVLALGLYVGRPFEQPAVEAPGVVQSSPALEIQSAPLRAPTLESLIAMSQQLEGRVKLYRDRFGDLPAGALVYQVELQDLIVQVDEELSMNPSSTELWGQRVNLLLDVTQLYENSLRRDYRQVASL